MGYTGDLYFLRKGFCFLHSKTFVENARKKGKKQEISQFRKEISILIYGR
jgi:hypothetical protein